MADDGDLQQLLAGRLGRLRSTRLTPLGGRAWKLADDHIIVHYERQHGSSADHADVVNGYYNARAEEMSRQGLLPSPSLSWSQSQQRSPGLRALALTREFASRGVAFLLSRRYR